MVSLELDVGFGAFVAMGTVDIEGEVVVAVASEIEVVLAGVEVGEVEVGWECGFCQILYFDQLVPSIKCFFVGVLFVVWQVREDLVEEGVHLGQFFDEFARFFVELWDCLFFLIDEDVFLVLFLGREGGIGNWRAAGGVVVDAVTFLIEHESARETFIFG